MTARHPRARKAKGRRKPMPALYTAIIKYVERHGGRVFVIGGIEVQRWPGEWSYNFRIAVQCTGTPPTLHEKGKGRNG